VRPFGLRHRALARRSALQKRIDLRCRHLARGDIQPPPIALVGTVTPATPPLGLISTTAVCLRDSGCPAVIYEHPSPGCWPLPANDVHSGLGAGTDVELML